MRRRFWIIIGIFLLALSVRLFQLETIPGEWYGDISIVHEYVTRVLSLEWPLYFEGGVGPFYHYVITPLIILLVAYGFWNSFRFFYLKYR